MSTNIPTKIANEAITDHQKSYLEGFFSGLNNRALSFADVQPEAGPAPKKEKLSKEEQIKRELSPFDAYTSLKKRAKNNEAPEGGDLFRYKWNGLFWLAPVHEGYMCRLRIPGGIISSHQLRELAAISDDIAWSYLQITTRNNLQLRVIKPKDTPELLQRIQDCGLHSRGSGGDNLRNFTSNPTAGIDPHELIDVSPFIKELAHLVVNQNVFYDLPRKFNVSYDGGGIVGVAEDTNDIGLRAIELKAPPEGHPLHGKIDGGIYFRIMLGGVTGHKEFAEDCGAICAPEDSVDVISAMIRVYIAHGNRGNRGKSRLIYLLKEWGFDQYLQKTDELLGDDALIRFDFNDPTFSDLIIPHNKPAVPHAHIGSRPQKQAELNWLGVYIPVGILQSEQARAIAEIADEFGTGDLRLTIFQNLLIPNIPTDQIEAARAKLSEAGLSTEASHIRGGVAACTGNRFCKYASSDTKGHAIQIVHYLEERITLDQPINIHVTGCPHSCAQHYIGDIGLLACKVAIEGSEEPAEGYHVFVGGGFGEDKKTLGRQLFKSVRAGDELNQKIHALLSAYLAHRKDRETFLEFSTRMPIEELASLRDC